MSQCQSDESVSLLLWTYDWCNNRVGVFFFCLLTSGHSKVGHREVETKVSILLCPPLAYTDRVVELKLRFMKLRLFQGVLNVQAFLVSPCQEMGKEKS